MFDQMNMPFGMFKQNVSEANARKQSMGYTKGQRGVVTGAGAPETFLSGMWNN